jgi:hypothetical protein
MRRLWLLAALSTAPPGCMSDPPPECIQVNTSCAPFYQPTFDNLYTMTLKDTCGASNASCHSAAGRSGGMSFADEASAYAALTAGRVKPGDPSCSKVVVRTSSVGASYQMPPGDPLREGERCALIQWVQAGAPAPGVAAGGSR